MNRRKPRKQRPNGISPFPLFSHFQLLQSTPFHAIMTSHAKHADGSAGALSYQTTGRQLLPASFTGKMTMNQKMLNALNEQIHQELFAFYAYLSMSAWLEANDWPGSAKWMRGHSTEEQAHAMKIYDYIYERGGHVTLQAIDQPPTEFDSVRSVFEAALEHERKVTAMINRIYELAQEEKDYPTQLLMHWYIEEQVEEEKIVGDALLLLDRAGDDQFKMMHIDSVLGRQEHD